VVRDNEDFLLSTACAYRVTGERIKLRTQLKQTAGRRKAARHWKNVLDSANNKAESAKKKGAPPELSAR
jgi:hypothetical protein